MANIITSDKQGRTDSAYHTFKEHLKCDLPIVIVSWVEGFVFNDALLNVKDYVLVCFAEYGWNFKITDSHIWGQNTDKNGYGDGRYKGEEWDKFDNWVKANPFKIIFKRELLKKDVTDRIKSIEYPCLLPEYPLQTKQQFDSRPIQAFQYWGRSNECRLRIHAEIWMHSYNKGFQVCDNLYYLNQYLNSEHGEKWVTLWIPHYARIEIKNLIEINGLSKLSLSWAGAGFKCFRTAEAPVNSVMVMHKNDYAWSFDWNENNCVLVEDGKEIEGIEKALSNPNLYLIYLASMTTIDKYRIDRYCREYLEPLINNA